MGRQVGSLHRSFSHPANLRNPIPIIPFLLSRHLNHPKLTHHPAWILMLTQTSQFFTQSPNLTIQILNSLTNSQIQNPARQHFLNPPFDPSTPKPKLTPPLISLIFPKWHQHTPPSRMNAPTTILQITPGYHTK